MTDYKLLILGLMLAGALLVCIVLGAAGSLIWLQY